MSQPTPIKPHKSKSRSPLSDAAHRNNARKGAARMAIGMIRTLPTASPDLELLRYQAIKIIEAMWEEYEKDYQKRKEFYLANSDKRPEDYRYPIADWSKRPIDPFTAGIPRSWSQNGHLKNSTD